MADPVGVVGASDPTAVCFLTGAGISIPAPSSLPAGDELTHFVSEWAFLPGTLDEILDLYRRLDITKTLPRLEVLLAVASSPKAHGAAGLDVMLSSIEGAPPNSMHDFFAQHLSIGGWHITANLDTCIERAHSFRPGAREPFHFHGSIDDDPASLGATFGNVEDGLDRSTVARLTGVLNEVETLIVVGYSGSDVFDMAPWLTSLADDPGSLAHLKVLWLHHEDGLPPTERPDQADRSRLDRLEPDVRAFLDEEALDWTWEQRESMRRAGADVRLIVGDSGNIIRELRTAWNLVPAATIAGPSRPRSSMRAASPEAVIRATASLWSSLGMKKRCLQIVEANPGLFDDRYLNEIRADRAWQLGRYREASGIWASSLPRTTEVERARWTGRQVACRWVSGSYLRAAVMAERAWRRRSQSAGDVDVELVESWLRCLDHMRRSPDLAWFPALRRQTGLAAADELLATEQLGEHLRIRLQSARERLEVPVGSAGEQQADARARFVQSESLSGVLNYRHGRMHGRDDLDRQMFARLRAWHLVIDATADAARVPLLPGAASHYTLSEQWRAIADVDFSMWHRLRLIVRANAHRLRQSIRRTT